MSLEKHLKKEMEEIHEFHLALNRYLSLFGLECISLDESAEIWVKHFAKRFAEANAKYA